MKQKKNGTNSLGIIALVIACASLCLSAAAFSTAGKQADTGKDGESTQYVMYVGTNDKDTYKPEHTEEEARDIVDKICLKYFSPTHGLPKIPCLILKSLKANVTPYMGT